MYIKKKIYQCSVMADLIIVLHSSDSIQLVLRGTMFNTVEFVGPANFTPLSTDHEPFDFLSELDKVFKFIDSCTDDLIATMISIYGTQRRVRLPSIGRL